MSAPATRRKGAEDAEIVLRTLDDSVGEPMDPASRYIGLRADLTPSSRRGFADRP
jgi:tRNA A37 threonylcarbamoyltransferase TsaD